MSTHAENFPNTTSLVQRLLTGIKLSCALLIGLPFLLTLLPLWFLYRWSERRQGHADPENPWILLWHSLLGRHNEEELLYIPNDANTSAPSAAPEPMQQAESMHSSSPPPVAVPLLPSPGAIPSSAPPLLLLTGGSSQLGRCIAMDWASLGYRIVLTYHRAAQEAEEIVAAIRAQNGSAEAIPLDQSDAQQIETVVQQVVLRWGIPQLLINNASLFQATPLQQLDWQSMEHLLRVNLQGPLWLAICVGRLMQAEAKRHAHPAQIIQICDIWGEKPLSEHSIYSTSKAGLIMATRSLARDLAPLVRVNGIAPGALLGNTDDPAWQKLLRHTPLAQHASAHALLQAIRYLVHAPYVTGEILHIDGGRSLN
ncbi:SDR family NAD(P)-dependent oxidoreductase [Candidatus Magnetaquicoccus inordinatus]|uniref:SDR family NAD(P)-dependent oxidoreductase n=1 Tax=Candidatus Magnetaquicoccus inordinatus TaxID=2496818 RepID=UPI00102BEAEA|nr:SDR family NAD(P)-dependent oxidoreductase [Candidatus Magnetaquicoccus inordinatus]